MMKEEIEIKLRARDKADSRILLEKINSGISKFNWIETECYYPGLDFKVSYQSALAKFGKKLDPISSGKIFFDENDLTINIHLNFIYSFIISSVFSIFILYGVFGAHKPFEGIYFLTFGLLTIWSLLYYFWNYQAKSKLKGVVENSVIRSGYSIIKKTNTWSPNFKSFFLKLFGVNVFLISMLYGIHYMDNKYSNFDSNGEYGFVVYGKTRCPNTINLVQQLKEKDIHFKFADLKHRTFGKTYSYQMRSKMEELGMNRYEIVSLPVVDINNKLLFDAELSEVLEQYELLVKLE